EGLPFQLAAMKEEFKGYDFIGVGRYHGVEVDREHESGHGEHCAIFYDVQRFELLGQDTFWLSNTPRIAGSMSWGNDLARVVTWACLMDRATRTQFYVFNTHFHWGEPFQRQASLLLVDTILSTAQQEPIVLAGDFNCLPESEPWNIVTGRTKSTRSNDFAMSDCWRTLGRSEDEGATSHGFTGKPEGRIDWILTSGQFQVEAIVRLDYNKEGRYPSDHFPVSATLTLSRSSND
ncbi:endonuclease/exonuclease/phosphatase family protein, partial [bacterium]|nr:endonuclease/exonuclease/phosphatase family protein [bacterium]